MTLFILLLFNLGWWLACWKYRGEFSPPPLESFARLDEAGRVEGLEIYFHRRDHHHQAGVLEKAASHGLVPAVLRVVFLLFNLLTLLTAATMVVIVPEQLGLEGGLLYHLLIQVPLFALTVLGFLFDRSSGRFSPGWLAPLFALAENQGPRRYVLLIVLAMAVTFAPEGAKTAFFIEAILGICLSLPVILLWIFDHVRVVRLEQAKETLRLLTPREATLGHLAGTSLALNLPGYLRAVRAKALELAQSLGQESSDSAFFLAGLPADLGQVDGLPPRVPAALFYFHPRAILREEIFLELGDAFTFLDPAGNPAPLLSPTITWQVEEVVLDELAAADFVPASGPGETAWLLLRFRDGREKKLPCQGQFDDVAPLVQTLQGVIEHGQGRRTPAASRRGENANN